MKVCSLLVMACALAAQTPLDVRPPADPAGLEPSLKRFIDVLSAVQANAASAPSVDKMVYEGAIPSMLRQLDPHTQFFDPGQFQQLKQMQDSEQKGFGSVVSVLPGQVIFLQTLPGTPSNKAGIQAGDELVAINNIAIQSLQPEQIIQLLTEARQHKITTFVRRQGASHVLQFTLTPELVDNPSVDRAFLLKPGVGYIRVTSWDMQTSKLLHDAIEKLGADNLQALVLDLRNNPGGLLNSAVDVLGQFLPPNTKVVSTQGRASSQQHEYSTSGGAKERPRFPLVVLVNEGSASGSEIVAGALKDLHRAIVVGETTFGKGSVQNVMQLPDGSALRFTTAKYYTPSRTVIQGNGVVPNILVPLTPEQDRAVASLRNNDKIQPAEATHIIKSQDLQMMRAIDALKGVMIYARQTSPNVDAVKK